MGTHWGPPRGRERAGDTKKVESSCLGIFFIFFIDRLVKNRFVHVFIFLHDFLIIIRGVVVIRGDRRYSGAPDLLKDLE